MLIKDILFRYKDIEQVESEISNESYLLDNKHILKIAPPKDFPMVFYEKEMILQEPAMHKIVTEKTSIPVQKIIDYGKAEGRNYTLSAKLPGKPSGLDIKNSFELGQLIRQLHDIKGDKFGYTGRHKPMVSQESWLKAFEIMWNKIVKNNLKIGGLNKFEADQFIDIFKEFKKHFDFEMQPSLLHANLQQNTVLINKGKISAILEWGRSLYGDPEFEFAIMDHNSLLNSYFIEGYGKKMTYTKDSIIRRKFYLAYELMAKIFIHMTRDFDLQKAKSYKEQTFRTLNELYDL